MAGELAPAATASGQELLVDQHAFEQVLDVLTLQSRMFVRGSDRAPD